MKTIGEFIDSIPKPVRDFLEGIIAAAVTGAVLVVQGTDLTNPAVSTKALLIAIAMGASGAVIAYMRRAITPPTPTP